MCLGEVATLTPSEDFFKIIYFYFLDTLILLTYFSITTLNNFWDDLSDISTKKALLLAPEDISRPLGSVAVLLFSKLNKIFFGYFHPEKFFVDNKNK